MSGPGVLLIVSAVAACVALYAWAFTRYLSRRAQTPPAPARCSGCGLFEGAMIPGTNPPVPMSLSLLPGDEMDPTLPGDLEIIALSAGFLVWPRRLAVKLCPACVARSRR